MKRKATALTMAALIAVLGASAAAAALPDPGMQIDLTTTALVVTDPQNDFLSPKLVVQDATAAAKVPEGDGYAAALVNFRFTANAVRTTAQVEQAIKQLAGDAE